MSAIKTFFRNIHRYLFLALIVSALLVWVYYLATDPPAKKKVVVYIDAPAVSERAMEDALERELPDGIKAVRVHTFLYDIMGSGFPSEADILIITREDIEGCLDRLLQIENAPEGAFLKDGTAYGIPWSSAGGYFETADTYEYFICFSKSSLHTGKADGAAYEVARRIIELG